jgi:beta-lactamase regulating signal transducer with metallopeptidase domain
MTIWRHWMVGQLDASIVAAALLAIALLARHRLSPRVRSFLLLIALVRLVLPPWIRSPWSEAVVDVPPIDEARTMLAWGLQWDVAMYVAAVTTAVSVFLLARIAWTFATAERRWMGATDPAPEWLQSLSIRLKPATTGSVEIRLGDEELGPMALGLRRKLIVLPRSILELDREALKAVLAHEMAHHERRDLIWIALANALTAVAWFNPLAHLMARALIAAREDGTDDWAVSRTSNDPFAYAQALLQSARMVASPQPLGAAGAHPMGARLQRLLDSQATREGKLGVLGIVIILLAATAAIPGAHMPSPSGDDDAERVVIVIRR